MRNILHPRFSLLTMAVMLSAALLLSSCGSSRSATTAQPSTPYEVAIPKTDDEPTRRLIAEAKSWLGTKYKYGGNDANGVDCSGFVVQVYNRALDIKLPRTSAQQHQFCQAIKRDKLDVGDLIFFSVRGGKKVGHVGIYIGDGRMIHSSTRKGVIISSLSEKYYTDNYISSGKVTKFHEMKLRSNKPKKENSKPKSQQANTPKQSTSKAIHPAHDSSDLPNRETMERDRQKALNSLINQIEDSIYTPH